MSDRFYCYFPPGSCFAYSDTICKHGCKVKEAIAADARLATALPRYQPDGERLAWVAQLLANWCHLRHTPPAERRLALVLGISLLSTIVSLYLPLLSRDFVEQQFIRYTYPREGGTSDEERMADVFGIHTRCDDEAQQRQVTTQQFHERFLFHWRSFCLDDRKLNWLETCGAPPFELSINGPVGSSSRPHSQTRQEDEISRRDAEVAEWTVW